MSVRTIFGDLITQGNTNLFQNLTVQGAYSTFSGNLLASSSTVGIGNAATTFGPVVSVSANIQSINAQSLFITGTFQTPSNVVASNALTSANVFISNINVSVTNSVSVVTPNLGIGAKASANALEIQGNLFASNALTTTNLFINSSNFSGTVNSSVTIFTSNLGIRTGQVGNTFDVQGNAFASNSITTTNVSATTLNVTSGNVTSILVQNSIGTLGANIYLTGNLYTSNTITTTNVIGNTNVTSANTTTLNVVTMNASIYSTVANGTFLNTVSIFGQSGFIGINTSTGLGATITIQNNIFASNALSGGNLVTSGTIYYKEDLFKRGPYLTPSSSNAAQIQAWISATCNASSRPTKSWWATSSRPVYANVASGPKGTTDYGGSVLLPDGRVLLVPQNASNVGFFNPATRLFSAVTVPGITAETNKFRSAVLVPNGNVVLIPWQSSNIGLFNPVTYKYSNIQVGAAGAGNNLRFQGGVLSPTGNVVMVPRDSANIGVFNPTTLAMTNVGPIAGQGLSLFGAGVLLPNGNLVMSPLSSGANIGMYNTYSLSASGFSNVGPIASTGTWETAVLSPDGNVIFPPASSTNVVVYNPTFVSSPITAGAFSNVQLTLDGANRIQGGCLLPSGNIVCCPADTSNLGIFDPIALTYSNCAQLSTQGAKFYGCTLTFNGQVVFAPSAAANVGILNTMVPPSREFCLSPYFNKF